MFRECRLMVQAEPEERSAKRYKLRNFMLRYSTGNLFSFMKKGKGEEHPLINMSATGLAFVTPESLPAQTPIKIVLEGSLFEQPLDLRGEVVYCHQLGRQAMYRIGVIFDGKQARKSSDLLEDFDQTVETIRMRVLCVHCGMVIKVKRKHEGKTTPCPRCQEPVKLVEPTEEDDSAVGTEEKVIEAVGSTYRCGASWRSWCRTVLRWRCWRRSPRRTRPRTCPPRWWPRRSGLPLTASAPRSSGWST